MRYHVIIAAVGLLLPGAASPQQHSVSPDANAVILAAIEAFVSQENLSEAVATMGGRIVLSSITDDHEHRGVSGSSRARIEARRIEIPESFQRSIERRTGLQVDVCRTLSQDLSLCGVPRPWIWLVLSAPGFENDRAVTTLEMRELADWAEVPDRIATSYEITLIREKGHWRVTQIELRGT